MSEFVLGQVLADVIFFIAAIGCLFLGKRFSKRKGDDVITRTIPIMFYGITIVMILYVGVDLWNKFVK